MLPEVVEAFVVSGLPGRAAATKGTYRSELRRTAGWSRLALATAFPGSPAEAPYSPVEEAELLAVATSQRSPARRSSALSLLALCAGAGTRAGELVAVTGDDVRSGRGGVSVRVAGRAVPVGGPYAKFLAGQAKDAGPEYHFRPGRTAEPPSKNLVNGFWEKLACDPGAPRFSSGRARPTFICGHLAAGTPLRRLLYIAGIEEVGSLLRYARLVPGAPASKAELRRGLAEE